MASNYFRVKEHVPASEDEARAKFAYFRNAEATIDVGPEDYTPALPLRPRGVESLCGTHSGYVKHVRDHTDPCHDCRNARATYQRDYRARKKVAA